LFPLTIVACAAAGLVLGAWVLAPLVPVDPLVAFVVGFGAVTGTTLAAARVAPVLTRTGLAVVVLTAVAMLVTLYVVQAPEPLGAVLVTAVLLMAGGAVGGAVGGRIEHPGHLLAVVVVSLLVDTFSVYHPAGPTAAVVSQPRALAVLALSWPMLGSTGTAPVLGVGDVIFASLYVAVSRRHGLGARRTIVALAAGLAATMLAVILSGLPIPALVGMGLAVLVAHPEARRLPAKDRRRGRVMLAILVALWLASWVRTLITSS
jgi:hypothetical protein